MQVLTQTEIRAHWRKLQAAQEQLRALEAQGKALAQLTNEVQARGLNGFAQLTAQARAALGAVQDGGDSQHSWKT